MEERRHIALAADATFSVPLALALYSLQKHLQEPQRYSIHLLDGGIERELLQPLELDIHYYEVGGLLRHLPASGRFPSSIYYRYMLPEILPAGIERVFYMDADTMLCGDISPLWEVDLGDCIMAACPWVIFGQEGLQYKDLVEQFCQRMGIREDEEPYFYSSMLLMDLKAMRREQICDELIQTTELYPPAKLLWPDQDVLNIVLRGRIAPLPLSYNVIPLFAADMQGESPEAKRAYAEAHIVHFAATKPNILTGPKYPFEEEFFELWRSSPWRQHIPYQLVSTYGMPRVVKKLILAPIKAGVAHPRFLRSYGLCLKILRALLRLR